VAPASYCARPPQVPAFLFVIDVSYNAVQSGMLGSACMAIRDVLRCLPRPSTARPDEPSPCKVGIITFDRTIHFYNLTASLSQPQMMVVSDVEDVFLPLQAGLLVNGDESRDLIDTLLDRLPGMFQATRETEPQMGAAAKAAMLAMENHGGKILLFQSVLPTTGVCVCVCVCVCVWERRLCALTLVMLQVRAS
jgi:protein transport protein SEC24